MSLGQQTDSRDTTGSYSFISISSFIVESDLPEERNNNENTKECSQRTAKKRRDL